MACHTHAPFAKHLFPPADLPATGLSLKRLAVCGEAIEAGWTIRNYRYRVRLRIADHTVQ